MHTRSAANDFLSERWVVKLGNHRLPQEAQGLWPQAKNGPFIYRCGGKNPESTASQHLLVGNDGSQRNLATAESCKEHRHILLIQEDIET